MSVYGENKSDIFPEKYCQIACSIYQLENFVLCLLLKYSSDLISEDNALIKGLLHKYYNNFQRFPSLLILDSHFQTNFIK